MRHKKTINVLSPLKKLSIAALCCAVLGGCDMSPRQDFTTWWENAYDPSMSEPIQETAANI